jgi:two-component system chemotaxis sensor kinase CheA
MPFDKSQFIEKFKAEVREHIQKLNLGLLNLEKNPSDKQLLEEMMRQAHTIKGAATMMGYNRIADVAHKMEDGLQRAMEGKLRLAKEHFDLLFKCLDVLEPLLEDKVTWESKGINFPYVDELCKEAEDVFLGKAPKKRAEKKEKTRRAATKDERRKMKWRL